MISRSSIRRDCPSLALEDFCFSVLSMLHVPVRVAVSTESSVEAMDAWRRSWLRHDEYQLVMLSVFLASQLEGLSVPLVL